MSQENFLKPGTGIEPSEKRDVYRQLLLIAGPIMLTNFLQTLYNLTDTYFLGQLGRNEVSSPATSFNIIFLLILFSGGFSHAGRTLISQAKGRGDPERSDFYLGQLTGMMLLGGLIITPLIQIAIPAILRLIAVPEVIYAPTLGYLRVVLAGLPFMFLTFALQAAFQGMGDSMTPFIINMISVAVNILLDWLLIFGIGVFPAMAVAGAAWATFIARALNAILALAVLLFRDSGLQLKPENLRPDAKAYKLIIRIGLPASLGQSAAALGFTVLQGIINSFGTAVIAAFNVGSRIINLFMMPAMGLSQATSVMVGQKLGARRRDLAFLALRQASLTSLVFISISMTVTFFFGNSVTGFFVPDPQVIRWGAILFRLVSPSVVFFALFTVFNGAFQGSGDTRPVAVLNTMRLWGIRLPVAFLLVTVLGWGPEGIWIGMILSNLLTAMSALVLLLKRPWYAKLDPDDI
ncbi:MATE family efflux transporter [Salinispira pacifica]|uniref:Multidrug-efflux transporter n=1 Tax=Salinispira pacifica TaxID=1307761 RepID=V5WKF3_9SPIO|nr:MATE family efflux transporter [Salinispira pacifica]AHC16233.1 Multi antimicrobial extrusion protein (Na(+)/drug antiporter) [Salinispira pacifica]